MEPRAKVDRVSMPPTSNIPVDNVCKPIPEGGPATTEVILANDVAETLALDIGRGSLVEDAISTILLKTHDVERTGGDNLTERCEKGHGPGPSNRKGTTEKHKKIDWTPDARIPNAESEKGKGSCPLPCSFKGTTCKLPAARPTSRTPGLPRV